jgi:hypothetical protein
MTPTPVLLSSFNNPPLRISLRPRILIRSIAKMRTPEIFARLIFNSHIEKSKDLFIRGSHRGSTRLKSRTPLFVKCLQVGNDEVILRPKQTVQTSFRYIRIAKDTVDANNTNTLRVKQLGSAAEQTLAGIRASAAFRSSGLLGHE